MRLSRPRVLLRAVLLAVGGAFMLWRAWEARAAGAAAEGGEAALLSRVALVEALVGALALVAAGVALLALRGGPAPTRSTSATCRLLPASRRRG